MCPLDWRHELVEIPEVIGKNEISAEICAEVLILNEVKKRIA